MPPWPAVCNEKCPPRQLVPLRKWQIGARIKAADITILKKWPVSVYRVPQMRDAGHADVQDVLQVSGNNTNVVPCERLPLFHRTRLPHPQRSAADCCPQQAVAAGTGNGEDVHALIEGLNQNFQLAVAVPVGGSQAAYLRGTAGTGGVLGPTGLQDELAVNPFLYKVISSSISLGNRWRIQHTIPIADRCETSRTLFFHKRPFFLPFWGIAKELQNSSHRILHGFELCSDSDRL